MAIIDRARCQLAPAVAVVHQGGDDLQHPHLVGCFEPAAGGVVAAVAPFHQPVAGVLEDQDVTTAESAPSASSTGVCAVPRSEVYSNTRSITSISPARVRCVAAVASCGARPENENWRVAATVTGVDERGATDTGWSSGPHWSRSWSAAGAGVLAGGIGLFTLFGEARLEDVAGLAALVALMTAGTVGAVLWVLSARPDAGAVVVVLAPFAVT